MCYIVRCTIPYFSFHCSEHIFTFKYFPKTWGNYTLPNVVLFLGEITTYGAGTCRPLLVSLCRTIHWSFPETWGFQCSRVWLREAIHIKKVAKLWTWTTPFHIFWGCFFPISQKPFLDENFCAEKTIEKMLLDSYLRTRLCIVNCLIMGQIRFFVANWITSRLRAFMTFFNRLSGLFWKHPLGWWGGGG